MKSSKGFRTGTRRQLKKRFREKFKSNQFLQEFKPKDKVVIKIEPSSQKGLPHPRINGKIGEVISKRGSAYIIKVRTGKKIKQVISRPEHLKLHGGKNENKG